MATGVFQAAFWQGAADQQGHGGVAVNGDRDWDTLGHPRSSTASVTSARLLLTGQSGEQVNLFPSSISGAEEKNISLINKPSKCSELCKDIKVAPNKKLTPRAPSSPWSFQGSGSPMDAQKNPGVLRQPQGCVGSPGEAQAVIGMLQNAPAAPRRCLDTGCLVLLRQIQQCSGSLGDAQEL